MTSTEQSLTLFGPGLGLDQDTALHLARGLSMAWPRDSPAEP